MAYPLAYFLTWTCYGTWFHGDDRGSVDREHNRPGMPFLPADAPRAKSEVRRLKYPPVVLDDSARQTVTRTIQGHCELRRWDLHALNVRTNHVHVVVSVGEIAPEKVLGQLKAWTTRRLRESGYVAANAPAWTEDGSKKYLWMEKDIAGAVGYVSERQEPAYH